MAKKKAEAAHAVPMTLYKVLTADGHSPYVDKYAWSLPIQREDGSWEPGAWHEESQKRLDDGYGLHITTMPTWHRSLPRATVYECEVEGCHGNAEVDRDLAALRVRLLRPVSWEEAIRVSEEWERGRHVRQAKADQKEHMDKIRKAAVQAQAKKRAEREAGVESPALTAFRTMVELTPRNSGRNINGARYDILKYATEYLDFDPDDVGMIYEEFKGAHWFGENGAETLYALAVKSKNDSACVAWEAFLRRKPWWCSYGGKKTRAHVGIDLRISGAWHTITSFREDYANARREGDKKIVKITREQMAPPKDA